MEWLYGGAPPPKTATDDDMEWLYAAGPRVARQDPVRQDPVRPAKEPDNLEKPARRFRFARLVVVLLVAFAMWLAFLGYAPVHAWNKVTTVTDIPSGTRPPPQPGTAILLVGSDSRAGLSAAERKQLGTGYAEGGRTDTMLIYYVPPKGSPALISLPRDSYLPIPGHGQDKLDAAYTYGGPSLLVQSVEDATGLRMDGYLEIGFGGFVSLVDLVGGIQVCLKAPMIDKDANLNLPAGCQTLDGIKALGYVRQRHQDPRGDLGRVERQREVIGKIVAKLAKASTLMDPVRYWHLWQTVGSIIQRGQDTGLGVLKPVAMSALSYAKGDVISLTVPISNPDANTPSGSSVIWDQNKADVLFAMIAKGDTSHLNQFR